MNGSEEQALQRSIPPSLGGDPLCARVLAVKVPTASGPPSGGSTLTAPRAYMPPRPPSREGRLWGVPQPLPHATTGARNATGHLRRDHRSHHRRLGAGCRALAVAHPGPRTRGASRQPRQRQALSRDPRLSAGVHRMESWIRLVVLDDLHAGPGRRRCRATRREVVADRVLDAARDDCPFGRARRQPGVLQAFHRRRVHARRIAVRIDGGLLRRALPRTRPQHGTLLPPRPRRYSTR